MDIQHPPRAGGIRYFNDNGLSAQFEYNTILGRDNLSEDMWSLSIRASY